MGALSSAGESRYEILMGTGQTICQRCGAHVAVPVELEALVMRCQYCGFEQPVPDMVERHRALEAKKSAAQMHASIRQTTGRINTMVLVFVGLILLGVVALIVGAVVKVFI